jgi:ornithine cyclodeaminase
LYCDNLVQSTQIGEFQYVTEQQKSSIIELGHLASYGHYCFSEEKVTLFDSSGIGLQDIAVASELLRLAQENQLTKVIDF